MKNGDENILMNVVAHNVEDLMRSYYLHAWDVFLRKEKVMKRI